MFQRPYFIVFYANIWINHYICNKFKQDMIHLSSIIPSRLTALNVLGLST